MNKNSRQILIALITFLSGLYFFVEWLLPKKIGSFEFGMFHEQISNGFVTIGAMAIGLGLINILRVHGGAIVKGRKGSLNSIALLLGILIMFVVKGGEFLISLEKVDSWSRISNLSEYSQNIFANRESGQHLTPENRLKLQSRLIEEIKSERENPESYLYVAEIKDENVVASFDSSLTLLSNQTSKLQELYNSNSTEDILKQEHGKLESIIQVSVESAKEIADENYLRRSFLKGKDLLELGFFFPLGAAMFSLLAFYISVAAYRSFRIRSMEALVMMIFAILVMLGQIPQGPLYISEDLPGLRLWLMQYISTPAVRAIEFGAIVAGLAMAVRMWLSLERSPLAVDDEGA